jgi:hypothetical protein
MARPESPASRSHWREGLLAGVCIALALFCSALAVAWKQKDAEAQCWRQIALQSDAFRHVCR